MKKNYVHLYDTTLRDGSQTQGVNFNAIDKSAIAKELDNLGIDYIEGGWPGANPTDDTFFESQLQLRRSRLAAFGMTRRPGRSAGNDPGLNALFSSNAKVICIVGKTWDFHVDVALNIELDENLSMISDSIDLSNSKADEVIFDAEHFFDGYKNNKKFAIRCLETALHSGARWLVLCDTNGGTLPHEISAIVSEVCKQFPGENVGIHAHDDTGNAVANSLAAVEAGARHVQGTLNGLGERCGNANLISIIPSLVLKMGFETALTKNDLKKITPISRLLDERLNRQPNRNAPYVGESAFAHKGGLHVSAVERDPKCYEHITPEQVGNRRNIVVSDQSGRSNILARFKDIGLDIDPKDQEVSRLVELVKRQEFEGYAYDGAEASFELLARRTLGPFPDYFRCTKFRVIDERRWNVNNDLITVSEATVKLNVNGENHMAIAEGNGPVNALDAAIRKVLVSIYPQIQDLKLIDYKVRILTPSAGTKAITRVMIESLDETGHRWSTVGVSANIIDASYIALRDSLVYKIFKSSSAKN